MFFLWDHPGLGLENFLISTLASLLSHTSSQVVTSAFWLITGQIISSA